jgi:hypothetical protein
MSKKKPRNRSHKSRVADSQIVDKGIEVPESERLDLRTASPVKRIMGKISLAVANLTKDHEKLEKWGEGNEVAREAAEHLAGVLNEFPTLQERLVVLDASGFSPPRLSYTASVVEGDKVSVLEGQRFLYSDIMAPELMIAMLVVKKLPGKGGGLVVENTKGNRMKVAMSHVVKL